MATKWSKSYILLLSLTSLEKNSPSGAVIGVTFICPFCENLYVVDCFIQLLSSVSLQRFKGDFLEWPGWNCEMFPTLRRLLLDSLSSSTMSLCFAHSIPLWHVSTRYVRKWVKVTFIAMEMYLKLHGLLAFCCDPSSSTPGMPVDQALPSQAPTPAATRPPLPPRSRPLASRNRLRLRRGRSRTKRRRREAGRERRNWKGNNRWSLMFKIDYKSVFYS